MPFELFMLLFFAAGSLVTFLLYGADKAKARRGAWRISEKALLSAGFFTGAAGALLAMRLFHHKTRHRYFYVINIAGFLWQAGLLLYLFVLR